MEGRSVRLRSCIPSGNDLAPCIARNSAVVAMAVVAADPAESGHPIRPSPAGDGWGLYLVCWTLAPAVFFTMSRNILPTYVLPGLVGFGCLVGEAWEQRVSQRPSPWILQLSIWAPILVALLVMVAWPRVGFQSQKEIVTACEASLARRPLFLLDQRRQYS